MLCLYIIGQIITALIAIILIIYLIRKMNMPNPVNRQMFSVLEQRVRHLEERYDEIQSNQQNKSTGYKINSLIVLDGIVEIPLKLITMAYNQKIAFITLNEYYSLLNIIMNRAENDDVSGFNIYVLIPVNNNGSCELASDQIYTSLNTYIAVDAVYSESMIEKFRSDDSYEIYCTNYAPRGFKFDVVRRSVMQTELADDKKYQKYQKYSSIINGTFFPKYYVASRKES